MKCVCVYVCMYVCRHFDQYFLTDILEKTVASIFRIAEEE